MSSEMVRMVEAARLYSDLRRAEQVQEVDDVVVEPVDLSTLPPPPAPAPVRRDWRAWWSWPAIVSRARRVFVDGPVEPTASGDPTVTDERLTGTR